MKHLLWLSCLLCLIASPLQAQGRATSITVDGVERFYNVRLPENYDPTVPAPVVIALHGFGGTGLNLQLDTDIDDLADSNNYISVFPEGLNNGWYYLDEDEMLTGENYVDDTAFLGALIDQISTDFLVIPDQIFLMGISNGGLLALRAGCDLHDRLAGVVSVIATYSFEIAQHCSGHDPIPVMIVWGSADDVFPFNGYAVVAEGVMRTSFSEAQLRTYLTSSHRCDTPTVVDVSDPNGAYQVFRILYSACLTEAPAMVYIIGQLTHNYPQDIDFTLLDGETIGDVENSAFEFFELIRNFNTESGE